jgi:ABC-type multidrug transport system ATPase subunit
MAADESVQTKAEAEAKAPPSEKPKAEENGKLGEAPPANALALEPAEPAKKTKRKKKDVEIAVRLTKLTKRFGVKTAVDGVSLKIRAGSVYGLIGPNGAGKTTTFSMLAGFLRPTEGAIEVLGYEPTQVDELRSRIGVLPQDALLPAADKVGEFLVHMAQLQEVPADRVEDEAREVLSEVEGRDWWNVRCGALSHGMAKRVQLAQALLGDPEVVLLDEPTSGLDPRVAYEVRQLIKGRKGRCTLIVSSHNLQELEEICDAAAVLDRGRVVASGSMSELTAAGEEVHIKIGKPPPGAAYRNVMAILPLDQLRQIQGVTTVDFDDEKELLSIYFERKTTDAEAVIAHALWQLLQAQVRISGVTKGKGLEQRVMELTD